MLSRRAGSPTPARRKPIERSGWTQLCGHASSATLAGDEALKPGFLKGESEMVGTFISLAAALRSIVVVIVLIVVSIVLSGVLGGLGFLGLITWLLLLCGIAVGLFLLVRAGNPMAAAGTILMPLSTWIAFFVQPPAFVWTGLFFIGAILIARGASADTPIKSSWPITLLRVVVGWDWVDNAQDHFMNNWLPGGGAGPGSFLQIVTGAAN